MSDDICFSPDAMEEVAADLEVYAESVAEAAGSAQGAIDTYVASSSEFVPTIPPHGELIEAQSELMEGVATSVLLLADAARQADEEGVDLRELLANGAHLVGGAATAAGRYEAIQRLLRLSVHGIRDVRGAASQLRLVNRYGSRPMPDIAAIRRELAGGQTMRRQQVRQHQLQRYRELKKERRALRNQRRSARTGMRTNRPLTTLGSRVDNFLTNTRAGRALSVGGRVLGGAGVVLGAYNTVQSIREGDVEGAVVNGLYTVGGALMLSGNPVLMGAGAVITVGTAIYDNWDTITDWGSSAASAVSDFGSSVVSGARDFIGGLF